MCTLSSTKEVVADNLCDGTNKPLETEPCNDEPCEVSTITLPKFFPKHMDQNCPNGQITLHKRIVCIGKKQLYPCNHLSGRDLAYILINAIT